MKQTKQKCANLCKPSRVYFALKEKKNALACLLNFVSFNETNKTVMCEFISIDRVCTPPRVYFTKKKTALARLLNSFSFNETNKTVMCEFISIDRECTPPRVYSTQKNTALARLLNFLSFNETNQTIMCKFMQAFKSFFRTQKTKNSACRLA